MQHRLFMALVCAMVFHSAHAVDKPARALPAGASTAVPLNAAGKVMPVLATQIQSINLSANAVTLTAPTASVTVTVNSQGGPCAVDVTINGQAGTTVYTVDSGPSLGNALPYSGKLTFNGPGTYAIDVHKSSWAGPGCSGEAKATVVVSADPNWPCNIYPGYIKQSGGLLGPGQFVCAPSNMPNNVTPMVCPTGTFFANMGATFGCVTQNTLNFLGKVSH